MAKREEKYMQPLLFGHFSWNDHNGFLEDLNITRIDKTNVANHTRTEEHQRKTVKHSRLNASFG